jgi:hypothetical protein
MVSRSSLLAPAKFQLAVPTAPPLVLNWMLTASSTSLAEKFDAEPATSRNSPSSQSSISSV